MITKPNKPMAGKPGFGGRMDVYEGYNWGYLNIFIVFFHKILNRWNSG